MRPAEIKTVVRGAGDLGSGVLHRLWQAGFQPVATDIPEPVTVRREVAFASAIYQGKIEIEGVTGKLTDRAIPARDFIPVIIDPDSRFIKDYSPRIIIDATMPRYPEKISLEPNLAPVTIGLGPGFIAGKEIDFVIETKGGNYLGQVISGGSAIPADGEPCRIQAQTTERVLRAPTNGVFQAHNKIGDVVDKDTAVGEVDGVPVKTELRGIIRGLIKSGLRVHEGLKLGDVDPRIDHKLPYTISYKARAIGGGVLEAVMTAIYRKNMFSEEY